MAGILHRKSKDRQKKQNSEQTSVEYDYSFNDSLDAITADLPGMDEPKPEENVSGEENTSDTPEEALAKFRREHGYHDEPAEIPPEAEPKHRHYNDPGEDTPEESDIPDDTDEADGETQDEPEEPKKKHHFTHRHRSQERDVDDASSFPRIKRVISAVITTVFILLLLVISVSCFLDVSALQLPAGIVANVITPVQNAFSGITDSVSGYLRKLKLRATLEESYEELRQENEELTYKAMMADEYQIELSQYEDLYDEINANADMQPIAATVIAKYDGNYFSTFTINVGSRDGVEPYMAVTVSGALIGYTETVSESSSTVRTIIDSDASIAALIQSSRDQGTIRGTLGVDGTALCRMYYLPDDSLPRPGDTVVTSGVGMSFPKGIPIGVVRESTRGMESNKSYVVIEPTADFEHIENVIVYRYQPAAEAVQGRSSSSAGSEFVPLETARPYPTLRIGSSSYFLPTPTPDPSEATATPVATATATPAATATLKPTSTPVPTATPYVYEYHVISDDPTPTPSPTPAPTATPVVTYSPDDLVWEDE